MYNGNRNVSDIPVKNYGFSKTNQRTYYFDKDGAWSLSRKEDTVFETDALNPTNAYKRFNNWKAQQNNGLQG